MVSGSSPKRLSRPYALGAICTAALVSWASSVRSKICRYVHGQFLSSRLGCGLCRELELTVRSWPWCRRTVAAIRPPIPMHLCQYKDSLVHCLDQQRTAAHDEDLERLVRGRHGVCLDC